MKKLTVLLMLVSMAAAAGPGHKNHKKSSWTEELGLSEAQITQVKAIKQAKHDKLMAYKEQLSADYDAQLAEVLTGAQMEQLLAMRASKEKQMAEKKHKKHKQKKGY